MEEDNNSIKKAMINMDAFLDIFLMLFYDTIVKFRKEEQKLC